MFKKEYTLKKYSIRFKVNIDAVMKVLTLGKEYNNGNPKRAVFVENSISVEKPDILIDDLVYITAIKSKQTNNTMVLYYDSEEKIYLLLPDISSYCLTEDNTNVIKYSYNITGYIIGSNVKTINQEYFVKYNEGDEYGYGRSFIKLTDNTTISEISSVDKFYIRSGLSTHMTLPNNFGTMLGNGDVYFESVKYPVVEYVNLGSLSTLFNNCETKPIVNQLVNNGGTSEDIIPVELDDIDNIMIPVLF